MRRGVLSSPYKGIAIACKRNSLKNYECAEILQSGCHIGFAKSVAFILSITCDLAIGDLAIECLGVHAIESLDVRVPPIL